MAKTKNYTEIAAYAKMADSLQMSYGKFVAKYDKKTPLKRNKEKNYDACYASGGAKTQVNFHLSSKKKSMFISKY